MKAKQYILLAVFALSGAMTSCSSETGRAYMPDMAYSRAYEFYSTNSFFANGITAQKPVAGAVARGIMLPDHIGEFDTLAAKTNTCSLELNMDQVKEGGRLYQIHCGICHGNNLDGNGPLYNGGEGKYPAAPANFKLEKYLNMPVGTMYHAIMYGKNLMGSYASQLDGKQRWMVLSYIKKVQSENGGAALTSSFKIKDAATSTTDSTKPAVQVKGDATTTTKVEMKADGAATASAAPVASAQNKMPTTDAAAKEAEMATARAKKAKENAAKGK
jgi:mono/diheme cytochrome c family protein